MSSIVTDMEEINSSGKTLSLRQINYQTLSDAIPRSGKLYVGPAGHYYTVPPWVCRLVVVRRGEQIWLRFHKRRRPLLSWYPDGRLVVGGIMRSSQRIEAIDIPVEFWQLIARPDLFEVREGDVYIDGRPVGEAGLLAQEDVYRLERQANYLANQLLPPRTWYDWWCVVCGRRQRFILQPRWGKLSPESLSFFDRQMHVWCQSSGIRLPKRNRKPVSGVTADSCIQSLSLWGCGGS